MTGLKDAHYITSTPFGNKSFKSYLSTSQELKRLQPLERKAITFLKDYLIQRNYTSYILINHVRDEHYQLIAQDTHPILKQRL